MDLLPTTVTLSALSAGAMVAHSQTILESIQTWLYSETLSMKIFLCSVANNKLCNFISSRIQTAWCSMTCEREKNRPSVSVDHIMVVPRPFHISDKLVQYRF